jgi:superfamily I DNA/RNA helicase
MVRPSFAIYDASAGSGKTYALVKEYLDYSRCKENDAYRNILAITFTNKAVHEKPYRGKFIRICKDDPARRN